MANSIQLARATEIYLGLSNSERDGYPMAFAKSLGISVAEFLAHVRSKSQPPKIEVAHDPQSQKLKALADKVERALESLEVYGTVAKIALGPRLVSVGFQTDSSELTDVQNKRIQNNLAHRLGYQHVRIFSPFLIANEHCAYYRRGSGNNNLIGIEMPREDSRIVSFEEIKMPSLKIVLPLCLGVDVLDRPYVVALEDLPHLLIGGSTGSGKSTGLQGLICGLLTYGSNFYMLMIDMKRLELSKYEDKPELLVGGEIIKQKKEAEQALLQLQADMEWRYNILEEAGVRKISEFNSKGKKKLPYIVTIIDELAVLMDKKNSPAETTICDLAARGRACGIHMIVATQSPSVNVITGDIKINFPSRWSFNMPTHHNSMTIFGMKGAEELLGEGDSLFMSPQNKSSQNKDGLHRIQSAYIQDNDIEKAKSKYTPPGDKIYYLPGVKVDKEKIKTPSNREIQRRYNVGFDSANDMLDHWRATGIWRKK